MQNARNAQTWFARGVAAARKGDLLGARRAFALAYSSVPSVDILWNLATTERLLGESATALQHLRVYVASPDARADRRQLAASELVPELEAVTARIRFDEPEGTVVLVDDKEVAHAATVDVAPGVHAIVIRRDGEEKAAALDASAGVVTAFSSGARDMNVAPRPGATTPVTVAAAPTSPTVTAMPTTTTSAAAGPAEALVVTRAPGRTTTVLALGGAATLAIGAGIVLAVVARSDQADADQLQVKIRDDDRTCRRSGTLCADYDSASAAAQRSMLLSSTFLATGGILGGAAIASYLLWPTSTTRVVPVGGKDVAGVGVSGRF